MGVAERHGLAGRLRITLREPGGRIVEERRVDNLITTAGRTFLAQLLTGAVQVQDLKIAIGTSANAPTVDDTALGAVVDAVAATTIAPATIVENGNKVVVATVTATLPALPDAPPQALQEAGILIDRSDKGLPVLYNHVVFPTITRAGNLEMTLTWEVVF